MGRRHARAVAPRSHSVQTEGGQAAHLLLGTRQLLLQGSDSFQGRPEPLSHLPKVRR